MASFNFGNVLPAFGLGMSMFGTGMSSVGAYQETLAQNRAAEWNATVKNQQADLAVQKADIFRQLGETERQETLDRYAALREEQRAAYGASGVDVNAGTPLHVTAETTEAGVYEAQKAKYQRDVQAWKMDTTAHGLRMEAEFSRANKRSPGMAAANSAIGGLTSAFSTWGRW